MQWHKMDIGTIIGGVAPDGAPYLKSFLIDYKQEFSVKVVNASCQKCLNEYHKEFIKKFSPMESKSKYKLLSKREGLPLEFGSQIFVTNKNITDQYAEKLIERFKKVNASFKLSDLFEVYPVETKKEAVKEVVADETTEDTADQPQQPKGKKQRAKRRK